MQEDDEGKGGVPHLRGHQRRRRGKKNAQMHPDSKSNHVQQDKVEGKIKKIEKKKKRREDGRFQRRRMSQREGDKEETGKPEKKPAKNHDQETRLVS